MLKGEEGGRREASVRCQAMKNMALNREKDDASESGPCFSLTSFRLPPGVQSLPGKVLLACKTLLRVNRHFNKTLRNQMEIYFLFWILLQNFPPAKRTSCPPK